MASLTTTSPIFRLAQRLKDDDDHLCIPDGEGVKEDALFLMGACPMIEAVLEDAEEREIRDKSVKRWLCDLKYLAADAEDVLEEYEYYYSAAHNHDVMGNVDEEEQHVRGNLEWLGSYIQRLSQYSGRPFHWTEGRNDELGSKGGESSMAPLRMTSPIIRLAQLFKDVASFLENTCPHIEDKLVDVDAEESVKDSLKCLLADAEDILKSYSAAHNHDVMNNVDEEEQHIQGSLESPINLTLSLGRDLCTRKIKKRKMEDVKAKVKELSQEIQKIRKRFDEIYVRRKALRLKERYGDRRPETPIRPPSGHLPNEPIIYGRDDDKTHLLNLLKNNNPENGMVIGLIGIGGIGKTALAQFLYNDEEIKKYFNCKAWVTVSETLSVVQITKNILESFVGKDEASNLTQLSVIQGKLEKLLQGKKFFLVLDDMWEEKTLKSLEFLLQMGSIGSKILITTRITPVVKAMATAASVTIELKPLLNEDGWDLFRRHAFNGNNENQVASDLVSIGKEIVKGCKGLPLLLTVLGDDLRGADKKRWRHILNHETWEIEDDSGNNKILEILKLSYVRLPWRLKQCFLHCSVFPKDHELPLERWARLWAAYGLIETEGSRQVYDIGKECIDGLLERSFFQSSEYKETMFFSLHDIMHDLAQYILQSEQSLIQVPVTTLELHRTLMAGTSQTLTSDYEPIVGRTLYHSWYTSEQGPAIDMLAQHLKRLRVLILHCALDDERERVDVPDSIGDLKHLRYLLLDYPSLRRLPDSVCSLHNLQTLECLSVEELPQDIGRLKRLQDLFVKADKFPPGIGELVELQRLRNFYVMDGDDKWAHSSELNKLTSLGGGLTIKGLENIDGAEEAKLLGLSNKPNLRYLKLIWNNIPSARDDDCRRSASVLTNLMPHDNLEVLDIENYAGAQFPYWLGRCSFDKLTSMRLVGCLNCVVLPTLGELPSLKYLCIIGTECLEYIGSEFYGRSPFDAFPNLEYLELSCMHSLEEWWGMDKCPFPRFSKLVLHNCPLLHFPIVDMDIERQAGLARMFDTITKMLVVECPAVEEWCRAHASTTLAKVEIMYKQSWEIEKELEEWNKEKGDDS